VSLKAPLRGRRVERKGMSETSISSFPYLTISGPHGLQMPALPSVIGMAPHDAVRLLSQQGFAVVVDGDGREVVDQTPTRGEAARNRQAAVSNIGEPVRIRVR
jgi:hypothetical protein